jgi:hypothetical protein
MEFIMKTIILSFTLILLSLNIACANEPVREFRLPVVNFEINSDGFFVNKSNEFYLRYMWKSFVALNWPNKIGSRGTPDIKKIPGSRALLVWETYPQPQEVFLLPDQWENYPDWDDIPDLPAGMTVTEIKSRCTGFLPNKDIVLHAINQPNFSARSNPVAPLIDQHGRYVRYQVTMNRRFFNYISANHYYNADIQRAAVRISQQAQFRQASKVPKGAFKSLPYDDGNTPGMIETKAAWRVLDPKRDDLSRYYTRPAYVLSPNKKKCFKAPAGAGLVALHIHRLTRLSHVASTFEQVDNVAILDTHTPTRVHPSFNPGTRYLAQQNIWPPYGNRGFSGPLPPVITAKGGLPPKARRQPNNISRAVDIPNAVKAMNREFQSKYKDSVLRYYQMIGVQHVQSECKMKLMKNFSKPEKWKPSYCPQPNGNRLINAALESYTQLVNPFTNQPYNYSCQGCHVHARPCGFTGEISNALTFRPDFMVMSYLLSKARFPKQKINVSDYSCNNSASQPFNQD